MKQRLFFAIAAGALLFVAGPVVQGQERTAPPPPPDRESSVIPAPRGPSRGQAPTRRQTPAREQTPARSQEPAGTPASPPARQAPAAQPAQGTQQAQAQAPAAGIPNKGFFWGGMIGAGATLPEAKYAEDKAHTEFAFGGSLFLGYDFGLFTGQAELLLANEAGRLDMLYIPSDGSPSQYIYDNKYSGMLFQIPLVAKMDLHLWRFVLQPMAGLYLNFGVGDLDVENGYGSSYSREWKNPLLGWLAGGALGFRLGRGFLFWDVRYMSNFAYTKVEGEELVHRSVVLSSLGYQHYFKQK
jgi:hypothetical protein